MKFPFLNLRRQALVVTVGRDGTVDLPRLLGCTQNAAAVLRQIADHLDAAHPATPCTPPPEADLGARGTYDTERGEWTDPVGHTWDLRKTWADREGHTWRWTGQFDRLMTPMMRANGTPVREPLDIVSALHGPLAPIVGDRS
ncbi:phiSA1p31-related protein [Streptomyces chryseus]|uniref:phiSA1p31-related protein n=1 Tax=Streptomyces chryseus TaxID=68186 RepID=UPI00110F6BF0|nr:phiSA1p31-related protein [Streptomyces chryseus]GGX02194.1 hypothetical protein GCM10010353_17360 [Streptomyces chryseus]